MSGLRASIASLAGLLIAAGWVAPALAQETGPGLDPSVAGFDETPCLSRSGPLTVHGANFGPGGGLRLAALTPAGFVTVPAQSWTDSKIVAALPDDPRFEPGRTYILGIALDGADAFLSNQVTAKVCPAAAGAATQAKAALPQEEEEDGGGVSFGVGIGLGGLFSGGGDGGDRGGVRKGGQYGGQGGGGYYQPGQSGSGVGVGTGIGIGIPVPLGSGSKGSGSAKAGPAAPVVLGPIPPANNADYEPGEIVALLESSDAADAFADGAGALGYAVLRRNDLAGFGLVLIVLQVPGGTTVAAGTAALRAAFPAAVIDANHLYAMQQGGGRYGLSLLGWQQGPPDCGAGFRIGVLDTGVDAAHPALAARKIESQSFIALKEGEAIAPADHGTAVAAIIIGDPSAPDFAGVVPGAELYFGAVFKTSGLRGQVASTEAVLRGLSWLAGKQVSVVNLSFAGPENAALKAVVNASLKRGLVLVAAAGNGGPTAPPAFPGAQDGVIAATAVDAGLGIYVWANQGSYVTFAAPGVDLYLAAPGGGGKQESGTSFAAPYVTAAVAQAMMAGNSGEAAVQKLASGSKDLGAPGRDATFGYGLVQLANVCAPK